MPLEHLRPIFENGILKSSKMVAMNIWKGNRKKWCVQKAEPKRSKMIENFELNEKLFDLKEEKANLANC